jgi:hypothetical protein
VASVGIDRVTWDAELLTRFQCGGADDCICKSIVVNSLLVVTRLQVFDTELARGTGHGLVVETLIQGVNRHRCTGDQRR